MRATRSPNPLVPAKAGTQSFAHRSKIWIPAFAGMSGVCGCHQVECKRTRSIIHPGNTYPANRLRSSIFWILPVAVCGISSTKTTSSGIHHFAVLSCM